MTAENDGRPNWYVVHTHPHAERKAAAHLARQGFEIYLPQYLKKRRHARKVELVAAPLFPRYLFIAIDRTTQRWRSVASTVGVSHLVCHGDELAALPDAIIAELRDREGENGFICADVKPRFLPGDQVRVVDGVFAACFGRFESMSGADRVAILLDLLGRKARVVLDQEAVVAV
jgi:transcriptional antiterminator RfaH